MRSYNTLPLRGRTRLLAAVVLVCSAASLASFDHRDPLPTPGQGADKLEATIFSYDGHEFIRTKTTLMTDAGKSAINTKLEHSNPAFDALVHKRSYTGDAVVFGRRYEANYAPLMAADGHLTGALFVAIPR